jgi:hypothetical protein
MQVCLTRTGSPSHTAAEPPPGGEKAAEHFEKQGVQKSTRGGLGKGLTSYSIFSLIFKMPIHKFFKTS